ncbi:MAG TPA: S8 family serine peptidase [Solirubrobacterales bacterium]|nr:S8 family serine peptidase [Solirubrobacterales bacterium]
MYLLDSKRSPIELDFIGEVPTPRSTSRASTAAFGVASRAMPVDSTKLAAAMTGVFDLKGQQVMRQAWSPLARVAKPPPAMFRERASGLARLVYRELVLRFDRGVSVKRQRALLKSAGLELRERNPTVKRQVIAVDSRREGPALVELCNELAEHEELVFATPNFVSEFRRAAAERPPKEQWHLLNEGLVNGQVKGEDVNAVQAWGDYSGNRSIVVAVLDDGVDIDHPNLKKRIWRNSNSEDPDRHGRDFFLPDDHPDHYNPRPKLFTYPYDQMLGNDIHGTPCAGVISTVRDGAFGIAPTARILPVKIFHADALAQDARVADAIRYAAVKADILSCSWSGPSSPDIELAIEDAGSLGRNNLGSAVFCATGNEGGAVGYPASHPEAIGVGASTDQAKRASYSNYGPEVDFVAPSSGGVEAIYTTDVANPSGRGFNIGHAAKGGEDGRHTNEFSGTSSATPLAAGVGALVLSARPQLSRTELRDLLRETADKIGPAHGYDSDGRSDEFGYGRVNAHAALKKALAGSSKRK